MMTVNVKGKTRADAETLIPGIPRHGDRKARRADGLIHIGRLAVFAGVRDLPTRVKCAILPWHTLHAALNSVASTSTEAEDDPMHAPIGGRLNRTAMPKIAEIEGHAQSERAEVRPQGAVDLGNHAFVRKRRAGEGRLRSRRRCSTSGT